MSSCVGRVGRAEDGTDAGSVVHAKCTEQLHAWNVDMSGRGNWWVR